MQFYLLSLLGTSIDGIKLISLHEWLRMVFLYSHLIIAALALAQVLHADVSIAVGNYTRSGLQKATHQITLLLIALWASGLAIIYLDTGFDVAVLMTKSKLILKLVSVVVLTINGFVLHRFSFPVVVGNGVLTYGQTLLLAITGSLSTSHWLMAAFIGASKPLGQLPLKALLCTYAFVFAVTILVGILCMSAIRQRLLLWRQTSTGKRLSVPVPLHEAAYTLHQLRDSSKSTPTNYLGTVDIII